MTSNRTLDRLVEFDERSRNYDVARRLVGLPSGLVSHTWGIPGEKLDQGEEGFCVGFGWAAELKAYPKAVAGIGYDDAVKIYRAAQKLDGFDDSVDGSSVIAGAKAVRAAGYIDGYHWAFNIGDVCQAVSHLGPVVVGTTWLNSMFDPDPQGLLEVDEGSGSAGGHCYLVSGIMLGSPIAHGAPLLRIRNSWGASWGRRGDAFIRVADFARLLADQGEACIPDGRHKVAGQ